MTTEQKQPRRQYRQTRRAESAADTRRRIIKAANECLVQAPLFNLSLHEVARRAGVSRTTIHLIYGSREAFFREVAKDLREQGRFEDVITAIREADAHAALINWLHELVRFYSHEYRKHRSLVSLVALDADASGALEDMVGLHLEDCETLARRLIEQGYVGEGVTEKEAVDLLWLITEFETFDSLYKGRNLTQQEITQRLISMAERTLRIQDSPR